MNLKFSGISCIFGSDEKLELVVEITSDNFYIDHEEGSITNVISDKDSIYVITDTLKCEVIQ